VGKAGRYDGRVQMGRAAAVVIVSATMFAQSVPPECPAERPVDDIIAEVRKEQSTRKHRDADASPTVHCSWGWCIDVSKTPPTFPEPPPRVGAPDNQNTSSNTTVSDTVAAETCGTAMKMALEAAHNVEVGDQSFGQKNYKGALLRYKDALEEKRGDVATHVRLGRVLEKLDQLPQAIEEYKAAQKLRGPEKWANEAKAALLRLQHFPGS